MGVDVVIVTHNSADHIERAITALGPMTRPVVIDNVSADGTPEVARSAGARVVENDVNAGFGAAANQGAALGHAELILFLNPDAAIDRENLERLLAAFSADPELGIASPELRYEDGSPQRVQWPFPSVAARVEGVAGTPPVLERAPAPAS